MIDAPTATRIRAAVERARACAADDALVDEALDALLEGPHRFVSIDPGEAELEGLLNLRLAITHTSLNPLEVGAERARRARDAIVRLDGAERARAALVSAPDAELRYATARFLHPPPPFVGLPLDPIDAAQLPTLVARWEQAREAPEPTLPWLRRKARQHLQFYRIGLGFPLYEARRRRIAARLPASVRGNETMRETFGALEQLGPILDNFVFDRSVLASFRDEVAIADFAFLYMQLADELVDNLLKLGGDAALRGLLAAHFDGARGAFVPFEALDRGALLAVGIDPESPIPKYALSVGGLVEVLASLRAALLDAIVRSSRADAVRDEVRRFFHHCFATFLDELELPTLTGEPRLDRLPYAAVAWHFHRKNHEVMTRWLALRARLLGLDPREHARALAGFGVLLASFQIFDDLKDVALDLGHQPSYPIELATRRHPEELRFLEHELGRREHALDRNDVTTLAVHLPGTVRDALRWARLLGLSSYDWFLEYVADYRWRRNWLVRARSFHRAPERDLAIEDGPLAGHAASIRSGVPVVDALFRYLAATEKTLLAGELDDETLAFVVDVIGYDHGRAIVRALVPDLPTVYRFVNLRMRMTSAEKASVLRRVVARHRTASERALVGLRESSGSLALTHKVARALRLPVPRDRLGR